MTESKIHKIALLAVFILAFGLRFYKLGAVPDGLYQDETAIAINAFSLTQTGRDEHNQKFPLYFKSFGDYKLPVYIYAAVLPVKFLGMTPFAVRLPSALFSFLTVIFWYLLVKKLYRHKTIALIAAAMLAVNPWHIHYARATFEVSIGLFLLIAGCLCLHVSQTGKKWYLFMGSVFFLLLLYSYNLTRLLSPLLFLATLYILKNKNAKISLVEKISTAVLWVMGLLPLALTFFSAAGINSAGGTLLYSSPVIEARLLEIKSYFVDYPFLSKIIFSMPVMFMVTYLRNIASYFSPEFYFLTGSAHGNHGLGIVGQFLLPQLPLILIGLSAMMLGKYKSRLFLSWGAITVAVASLTREAPHSTRSFFLIPTLIMASSLGLFITIDWIGKRTYKLMGWFALGTVLLYFFAHYLSLYYVYFPKSYAPKWRYADREAGKFIKDNMDRYDRIIIDDKAGLIYTSILFYLQIPPRDFLSTAIWSPEDSEGFSHPLEFTKFIYKPVNFLSDLSDNRTMLVVSADTLLPPGTRVVHTVYYPDVPSVYPVGGNVYWENKRLPAYKFIAK